MNQPFNGSLPNIFHISEQKSNESNQHNLSALILPETGILIQIGSVFLMFPQMITKQVSLTHAIFDNKTHPSHFKHRSVSYLMLSKQKSKVHNKSFTIHRDPHMWHLKCVCGMCHVLSNIIIRLCAVHYVVGISTLFWLLKCVQHLLKSCS